MSSPSNKLLHNNISNHFILATLMVAPEHSPEVQSSNNHIRGSTAGSMGLFSITM